MYLSISAVYLYTQLHPSEPRLKVEVFGDNTVDLFGKTVNDLQSGVSISNNTISGDLKYIADYTSAGYDMTNGTNFVVTKATPTAEGNTIEVTLDGVTKTLDEDGILITQMNEARKSMSITYTEKADGETVDTYTLALSGLTLLEEV